MSRSEQFPCIHYITGSKKQCKQLQSVATTLLMLWLCHHTLECTIEVQSTWDNSMVKCSYGTIYQLRVYVL